MPGTQIAAGNFLLCFAILMAGGSASEGLNIFQHMLHTNKLHTKGAGMLDSVTSIIFTETLSS